jgi:hypothetical protein
MFNRDCAPPQQQMGVKGIRENGVLKFVKYLSVE